MSSGLKEQKIAEKQQNESSLNRKIMTSILKSSLLITSVVCLLSGFLLTPWGTKVAANSANKFIDDLTIEYKSGGLGNEVHLSLLQWKQPAIKVDIHNLRLSIQLSCVFSFALCIDSVATESIVVQIQPTALSPSAELTTTAFTLPFSVSMDNISLNDFSLKVQDTLDVTWQTLTGKLDFYQSLRIEKMQLDGFNLTTYTKQNLQLSSQSEHFDWTKWQYQPIIAIPIVLPINFDVLAFNMSDPSLQLAGQEQIKLQKVSLKAKGNKEKLQLNELFIEHIQGQLLAKGNVQLKGDFEHVFSADANVQLAQKRPGKLTPLKLTLRSSGNINSLITQVELIETSLSVKTQTVKTQTAASQSEPLKLVIDISAQPSQTTLPIKIKIDWSHLAWPLVAPEIKSDAGSIEINGDLSALNLRAQTTLTGQKVPDSKINISAIASATPHNKSIELNEFLLKTLGGQVLSKGQLTFSDYINWQGSSVISQLDPSVFWPELVAHINAEVLTEANNSQGIWKARLHKLNINGQWQGYPLSASGSADFHQKNGLQLHSLLLKNADNTLSLDGDVTQQQTLDIRFMLNAQDLSKTFAQLDGTLNLSGNISGSSGQPEVTYKLTGNKLMFSEVFIQQITGRGNIKWNDKKPVDLTLELLGIQGIDNQIDNAKLMLTGDASEHHLDLITSGQNTSVNLNIQGQLNQTSWQGNWLTGEITSSYANLSLLEPFKIEADWAKNQYYIDPHCWRHTDNELCIKQAEFKQNKAIWDVSVKEFDMFSVIRRFVPGIPEIQTNSRINLKLSGDWDIEQLPNAILSASLSPGDWVFSEQNNLQLTLNETLVKAQVTQDKIMAKINLSGNKIGTLRANVEGDPGMYADPLTRPIQGELQIEHFDLATFKALLPQLDVLQGDINGQAKIDGTLGRPLLTGELMLANGVLKDESLPVALSAIEQSVSLRGQSAEFKGSYKLGKGLGEMKGDITWIPDIKGHLHILGEELEFNYQNMIKAKVSPNIHLMFEPNILEINGEVTIPYARVKVRELPKGSISPSKDVILVERQAELDTSQQRLALNVLLKVDPLLSHDVKLDAFGLTTDLRGELRLQNNKSEIFGNGEVQLINGRYRAYGQNLLIREGDIIFTRSLDMPFLNIEAVRDPDLTSDSVVAGLRIAGVGQNPTISVFSEPGMEQQQILSYMLTGRGLGESSGDTQDIILTNALLSLGLGKSENLISKVGNKLGFADVNLDTSGQGDATQLSLTGTIAPGVQLRYGVGVFDSISEVAIRYELMPKLYIEAISGLSNAVDIYYQFSIEGSQNKRVKDD